MGKYTLFGEEIEFSNAEERYIKWNMALIPTLRAASNAFNLFYEECGNISTVLDSYAEVLVAITEEWAIEPLFKTLIDASIYDVSRKEFERECWDLSGAEDCFEEVADAYNRITTDLADKRSYRAARKASRGRVIGGGFGVGGALKGMAAAGAINAVTGLGHSIVNAVGNAASSISAASDKSALYDNDGTRVILLKGVRVCIMDIFCAYHDFMNDRKDDEWFDGSNFDVGKSDTIFKNAFAVPKEKKTELLKMAFVACPFNEELIRHIFKCYEEEMENAYKIAKQYKIDLNEDLLELICDCYSFSADEVCSAIERFQPDFDEEEKESIIKAYCDNADKGFEDYEFELSEIRQIMEALSVSESEALENYEYEVLMELADEYEDTPFGQADRFVQAIVDCKVSDESKKEYVYDTEIWELFEKYSVKIPDDEKLLFLFKKYQDMLMLENLTNEMLKGYLDAVIKALGFATENGVLPYETRLEMFECLTEITLAKLKSKIDVIELEEELNSDVANAVEKIISNSDIGFLTTSLTYKRPTVIEAAQRLAYCDIGSDEHPFIIYDERPIMHPGEYGFCFTDKRFVGKLEYGGKYSVKVSDIISFEKKGLLSSKFVLHTKIGDMDVSAENLSELSKFVDCLNDVLKVIPQNAAKVSNTEDKLNKQNWVISAECIDEHPYLIEYFGMEEKAEEIYEKSGMAAKRRKFIEECTDENLCVCDITELEGYLSDVKRMKLQENIRVELFEKITAYIDLIKNCKDKKTLALLEACEQEKISEHPYDQLCNIRVDIEAHKFLPEDKKRQLLSLVVPRINLLDFENRLLSADNNYEKLVAIFEKLGDEPIDKETVDRYAVQLKEKITHLQGEKLCEITEKVESMKHSDAKEALRNAECFNFDQAVLQVHLNRLNSRIDTIEQKVLAEFCEGLNIASISEIEAFYDRLSADEFRAENIKLYRKQIDERYGNLIYERACNECKRTVLFKVARDKEKLLRLIGDLENCGKTGEEIKPYIERTRYMLNALSEYEQNRENLVADSFNALVDNVSSVITKKVLPQTRECYKPEVYIQGEKNLKEYSKYDCCKDMYVADEKAIFYSYQLNGKEDPILNLSVTNNGVYVSKTSLKTPIKIPLESITGLKPAKIFNEIAIISTVGQVGMTSVLPYKQKECLANAIIEIIGFVVKERPSVKARLTKLDDEYMQRVMEGFERHSIPNDDEFDVKLSNNSQAKGSATIKPAGAPSIVWKCKCGKENTGKFCGACGGKKDENNIEWVCDCGSKNTAKFCPSCGKKRL